MNPHRHTTEHRPLSLRERIVALYTDEHDPKTIVEISRALGIGRETVREHLIRANVPRRAQKARGSRDEAAVNEAIERYCNGETLWQIANDLGKTATTVRSWLIDAGVERRRPGVAVNRDSLQETIRLYQSGMTIDEVASEQGLHPWTVRQRLVNAKVPRRPRGRRAKAPVRTPIAAATMERHEPVDPAAAEQPGADHSPVPGSVGGLDAFADALDRGGDAAVLDAHILAPDAWTDAA